MIDHKLVVAALQVTLLLLVVALIGEWLDGDDEGL